MSDRIRQARKKLSQAITAEVRAWATYHLAKEVGAADFDVHRLGALALAAELRTDETIQALRQLTCPNVAGVLVLPSVWPKVTAPKDSN